MIGDSQNKINQINLQTANVRNITQQQVSVFFLISFFLKLVLGNNTSLLLVEKLVWAVFSPCAAGSYLNCGKLILIKCDCCFQATANSVRKTSECMRYCYWGQNGNEFWAFHCEMVAGLEEISHLSWCYDNCHKNWDDLQFCLYLLLSQHELTRQYHCSLADRPQRMCVLGSSHATPLSEVSGLQSGVNTPHLIWFPFFIFSTHQLGK